MNTETPIYQQAPSPGIYRRQEIPFVEQLLEYKQELIKDFLAFHTNWYDLSTPLKDININNFGGTINGRLTYPDAWKTNWVRYESAPGLKVTVNHRQLPAWPTMQKILARLEPVMGHLSYSIMEPHTVIDRHTGGENRTGTYLRVHIPLIVPEGDIFFEVNGEEITWDEPFGFNNQYTHSAHNLSEGRRVILLIDLKRDFLGLPPCPPYNSLEHRKFMARVPPFTRAKKST
jgi:hypothetical protein